MSGATSTRQAGVLPHRYVRPVSCLPGPVARIGATTRQSQQGATGDRAGDAPTQVTTWASASASQPPPPHFMVLQYGRLPLSVRRLALLRPHRRSIPAHPLGPELTRGRRWGNPKRQVKDCPAAVLGPGSSASGAAEDAAGNWQGDHGSLQQVTLRRDTLGVARCPPAAAGAQGRACEGQRSPRRRRLAI